jgi:hypothetical protein
MPMYTPEERERVRSALIAAARLDGRIAGAALTGSASVGKEDRWSDIDLAFGVADADLAPILADWTERMDREHGAVHHTDVRSGAWVYRVFLLANGLQVDLAFAPQGEFGARAPTFRLLFGAAADRPAASRPDADQLIGLAWLYALHVRSSLGRGRLWQAEYMISAVRDHTLALACLRHGLPTAEARGTDQLPDAVTRPFVSALVGRLEPEEIVRAFGVAIECLVREIREARPALGARLEPTLHELVTSTRPHAASDGRVSPGGNP